MDLRAVNPGSGRTSGGLLHLRVLALGHYVFSHEWQVDWIAPMSIPLRRPSECILRESIRRCLSFDKHILALFQWGSIDFASGRNLCPSEEEIYMDEVDVKNRRIDTHLEITPHGYLDAYPILSAQTVGPKLKRVAKRCGIKAK